MCAPDESFLAWASITSMPNSLGSAGKRQPTGTTLKALELPADGSPLSLIQLKTIEADAHLFGEPDLMAFGGLKWPRHGNPQMLEIGGQRDGRF